MDIKSLKSILEYNPNTGNFTWLVRRNSRASAGAIAGSKRRRDGYNYIVIYLNGKAHLAHRLAFFYMTGQFPFNQIDHINGDGSDNRWNNLREVSCAENLKNSRKSKRNKSGITGVLWKDKEKKWQVTIGVNYVNKYLGSFYTIFEAASVRKSAENKYGFHKNHGR